MLQVGLRGRTRGDRSGDDLYVPTEMGDQSKARARRNQETRQSHQRSLKEFDTKKRPSDSSNSLYCTS